METNVFKSAGGCAIKLDVYPGPSQGPAPTVVFIHGGALIMGGREGIQLATLDQYRQAGFTQVSIDYRLAPETKLPEIIEDVKDAFRWVRTEGVRRYNVDPERIAVMGRSAGGYLSLMAGFHVHPRPRAIVSFYGYGDVAGPWYSRPDPFYCCQPLVPTDEARSAVGRSPVSEVADQPARRHFYLYCRQNGIWPREVVGLDPDVDPAGFDPFCPDRHVTPAYPPTLLLHGTADTDVPYELSVRMAEALERAGVPHELITIPEGGHGFDASVTAEDLREGGQTPAARAVLAVFPFLARHTLGAGAPAT